MFGDSWVISRSLKGKAIKRWTLRKFSSSPVAKLKPVKPDPQTESWCQDSHSDSDDDDPFMQGVEARGTLCLKLFAVVFPPKIESCNK